MKHVYVLKCTLLPLMDGRGQIGVRAPVLRRQPGDCFHMYSFITLRWHTVTSPMGTQQQLGVRWNNQNAYENFHLSFRACVTLW